MNKRLIAMWVQDYLQGGISLDGLSQRVTDVIWSDRSKQPEDTLASAQLVDLLIADFTGGALTAEGFRAELKRELGINDSIEVGRRDGTVFRSSARTVEASMGCV